MTERMVILCLALFVFGLAYNALVDYADRRGYLAGFTWLAVVFGVGMTLAGVVLAFWSEELQGWQFGWISLAAFASSGAPMAFGAVARYVGSREEDKRSMRAEALQSWWINE